jgi:hypothetical protein
VTTFHTSAAEREALPARPRAALPALCATQITGYGATPAISSNFSCAGAIR